jgi:hypothetical protein
MSDLERKIQSLAGKYIVTKRVFEYGAYTNVVMDYSAPGSDPIKIEGSCVGSLIVVSYKRSHSLPGVLTILDFINYIDSITFNMVPKTNVDEQVHKITNKSMSITFYNYIEVVPGGTKKATFFDYPKDKDLMTNASIVVDIGIWTTEV